MNCWTHIRRKTRERPSLTIQRRHDIKSHNIKSVIANISTNIHIYKNNYTWKFFHYFRKVLRFHWLWVYTIRPRDWTPTDTVQTELVIHEPCKQKRREISLDNGMKSIYSSGLNKGFTLKPLMKSIYIWRRLENTRIKRFLINNNKKRLMLSDVDRNGAFLEFRLKMRNEGISE